MRDETDKWLRPMVEAAEIREIDIMSLMSAATMPAAEADDPWLDKLQSYAPSGALRGIAWVRFGQLLRHELGWDDTYPAFPDYPEIRD
ncbi:hypothetical protein AB0E63_06275 [Kribbella sp. NPDC026596]|uniref:hypothetical protein n=1 Tax=Kribbella sp. NPDC026596 TaxID=3155122 RepID=UPI0033CE1C27